MKECWECKKELSGLADKCPHCGAPAVSPKDTATGCLILLIIVGVVVFWKPVVSYFNVTGSGSPVAATKPVQGTLQYLRQQVSDKLVYNERLMKIDDENGYIHVDFKIRQSSESMIKYFALDDMKEMLSAIATTRYGYKRVIFSGYGEMVDSYGNESDKAVITATFDRKTVNKINFAGFQPDKIPTVADHYWEYPRLFD